MVGGEERICFDGSSYCAIIPRLNTAIPEIDSGNPREGERGSICTNTPEHEDAGGGNADDDEVSRVEQARHVSRARRHERVQVA